MQPDYKLYQEMVRRGSRGRWYWLIGVRLYSAGLLGMVLVLMVWPVVFFFKFGRTGLAHPAALVVLGGLAMLGSFLRKVSYRIVLGEGIDITAYFEKSAGGDMKIIVRKPTEAERKEASSWPVWEKEASSFPWEYSENETCLILEGEVTVDAAGGSVSFGGGDYVVFPRGLACTWHIKKAVRKHYKFG